MTSQELRWFAVRCVFHHEAQHIYEERVTLWQAETFDRAIADAEREAAEYAAGLDGVRYLGLAQAFHMFDQPVSGAEVFSLMRDSTLEPETYLTRFFDTGDERQQQLTQDDDSAT